MNVHHLELFYYVARHGGISKAVRHIPYGIQQPAVSGQMLALEQDLGKRLFERMPFRLTAEGEELYAFVAPFFDNLAAMSAKLRKQADPHLRIGASEVVLREHLPAVLGQVRKVHPKLKISLRSGFQTPLQDALQEREIDLAIVPLESKPPAKIRHRDLVTIPLVLLAPKKAKIQKASELWFSGVCEEPLICMPPTETVTKLFTKGLQRLKVEWPVTIEASSLDLVTRYVANGYGYGVTVGAGDIMSDSRVKALPLDGFEPLEIVALWNGEPEPMTAALLAAMKDYAARVWPDQVLVDGK